MNRNKVLIADDEKTILLAGKMLLEGEGFKVLTAENGQAAIDIAKKERPDFMLLDIMMPEKDGFEVCKEITGQNETDTVIIVFSGDFQEIEKGFDYGADDCMMKPLNWGKLVERMEELASEKWENSR